MANTRDEQGVNLYFNKRELRAIELCNERLRAQGLPELSRRQFAKAAIQEKIQRELNAEERVSIETTERGSTLYPVATKDEIEELGELPEL